MQIDPDVLQRLRWTMISLKLSLAIRRYARKFSPDQPRVPAGDPGGGQWTSGGEGAIRKQTSKIVARRISPAVEATCERQYD